MKIVKIYTKSYCPYCTAAKNLLNDLAVNYQEIDITNTPEIIEELSSKSGFRTVPQIFVDEEVIGGYTDLAAMHERGEFLPKVK